MGRGQLSTQLLFRETRSALPCVRVVLSAIHQRKGTKVQRTRASAKIALPERALHLLCVFVKA